MAGWIGLIRGEDDKRLITDCVTTYINLVVNEERGRGTKMLARRIAIIEEELENRGILSSENIRTIHKTTI